MYARALLEQIGSPGSVHLVILSLQQIIFLQIAPYHVVQRCLITQSFDELFSKMDDWLQQKDFLNDPHLLRSENSKTSVLELRSLFYKKELNIFQPSPLLCPPWVGIRDLCPSFILNQWLLFPIPSVLASQATLERNFACIIIRLNFLGTRNADYNDYSAIKLELS